MFELKKKHLYNYDVNGIELRTQFVYFHQDSAAAF